MKYYIMLECGIVGMGGGQMYINNKSKFMSSLGWSVLVFSGLRGRVLIPDLEKYSRYIFDEFAGSPLIFSKKHVQKIISVVRNELTDAEEIIIESGTAHATLWGELFAEEFKAKHIVYILDERPDRAIPNEYLPFYKFKLDRRELAGITDKTVSLIFRNNIEAPYNTKLLATCQNTVEDYDSDILLKIPTTGINIGILGRLDKPYVSIAVSELYKLTSKHKDTFFNIIFIGASDIGDKEKIFKKTFKTTVNVKLIFLGYLYPIPRRLFCQIDYFVASAGSAGVAYRENKPTISIDGKDGYAIGALGYTTMNSLYRKEEKKIEVGVLLEKVIFDNYLSDKPYIPCKYTPNTNELFSHISFLNETIKDNNYFPILSLKASGKDKKKRILRQILGTRLYFKLRPVFAAMLKK